jgi:hypothetical protein
VLIAASPYPRQIQDLGAPMGFRETFNFMDAQERSDMREQDP